MRTLTKSMKVSAALNHAAYTFQSFRAADWLAMAEECRLQAEQATCIDCGADMGIPMIEPDPSEAWEIIRRGRVSVARCKHCGFEAFPFADATIGDHMKACEKSPKKREHRRRGDRWSCQ